MEFIDKIYIISLDRHKNRRESIKLDLNTAGVDDSKIEWVTAVDGNDLDINECLESNIISDTFIDPTGQLTMGIYGCSLSHQSVYKKFLETPSEIENCLILEDDATVSHTLLRMLLPNSFGYTKFIEEMDTFDWDVISLGSQLKQTEYTPTKSYVLKKAVQYPINYAAHSYIVNKNGAKKLIDSNTPIKFAADVNIHCSDINLYTTPTSYFLQKQGEYPKWLNLDLENKFKMGVMYYNNDWDLDEVVSATTIGDYNPEELLNGYRGVRISNKIETMNINWKPFTAPNGDTINGWANINLKTNKGNKL